ncbi:FAD-binding domain-containing protein [Paracoccus zeaxanthinifaciens]|uniref:FAD-binding domain-containing protein n=1 Tax=Paracoccus zeaxanthinifaciens TaxID=187400 RepID=UPI0004915638|nr:FAD-binding domain-containing protein [Paracoccus zeaxanthinifaciens]
MTDWPDTRRRARDMLDAFIPHAGAEYARNRGMDLGPGSHRHVSRLSPALRHRLVTERECIAAALDAHGQQAAKFVDEVFWRSYFKGWLEQRPQVWTDARPTTLPDDRTLDAMRGRTGIDCFDAWVRELVATGYLHNHARMWFASIWIFTLRLDWRLGADFFLRHLLDGDAASNTLSWRWVAGLHSQGKSYRADPDNIARFTDGRFRPTGLASEAPPLSEGAPPPRIPLPRPAPPLPEMPAGLLITAEDCRPEDHAWPCPISGAATLAGSHLRSSEPVAPMVRAFEEAALADAARRHGGQVTALHAGDPQVLVDWAADIGVRQIVTPYVPAGPMRDWLDDAAPTLDRAGIVLRQMRRDWDDLVWPHATAGYFKLKKNIPRILQAADLG